MSSLVNGMNRQFNAFLSDYSRYSEIKQLTYNIAALQQKEKGLNLFSVLSFFPGEGKTLFCAALAIAYADAFHANVLVVDTTTFQNKGSLLLEQCIGNTHPLINVVSLDKLKSNTNGLETEKPDCDFSIAKIISKEGLKKYGLVLLDTVALEAKNKNNVDPLLLARLSSASILIVSQALLKAPNLSARVKMLEEPALHLTGVISNEAHNP